MTSVRQNHVSTVATSNHDNNLDALLEELQTSVSRPGSALNGPVTGYREVTRTVTTETDGHPTTTREYHIEYLNPSNTTTVLQELPQSNYSHDHQSGRSYKTMEYKYNSSSKSSSHQDSDVKMRQNITELDSLLDDLHTAQKTGFAESGSGGVDPGLLEPIESSTPRSSHVSRSSERRFQEQRYGSVGASRSSESRREVARSSDGRRDLVFTGGSGKRDLSAPLPVTSTPVARQEVYTYESKTTRSGSGNSRDMSPPQDRRQASPSPARQLAQIRSYNYSTTDDVPRTPTLHRSPSPAGGRSSSHTAVRQYNYSSSNDTSYRSPSPRSPPVEPPRGASKMTSYSYSSSRETKQEVPRSPPPHRSPSPVSFNPPPLPTHKSSSMKSYNFEQSQSGYVRPQSPQPVQKFSPSDPSRTLTYQVSPPPPNPTVVTYKYSRETTTSTKYPGEERESVPLLPRPFPTPSPTPETQQQPPKKLDELMASFSDTEIQQRHESSSRYVPVKEPPMQRTEAPVPAAPPAPPTPPSPPSAALQAKSKNISGPPVYYPPGVQLFAKKEESMMQSQSGGGKWAKSKSKYEYESGSKMKSKESSGKAVVPVCLPVCCAMPCVIM